MPMTLVLAAKPYLKELKHAVGQSRIQVVTAEFERAVSLALEHQPDLILLVSPPIPNVLQTCERLLENEFTKNIPIFLLSLDHNMIDDRLAILHDATPQARAGGALYDKRTFGQDNDQNRQRQQQLLSILDLLRYAEAEIAELGIETSAVLLGATITDVAKNLQ